MKLYHFTIIFAAFFLATVIIVEMHVSQQNYVLVDEEQTELAFDDAVDAATNALVANSGGTYAVDKDAAVEAFFTSLCADFGIIDEPVLRRDLEMYVPVIAVTVDNGFYIWYDAIITDENGHQISARTWTEKIPYSYDDGFFIYSFTNGSEVTVYDYNRYFDTTAAFYRADVSEITAFEHFDDLIHSIPSARWSDCLLTNESFFNDVKGHVIAQTLEENLNYYCNEHNKASELAGVSYKFSLPEIDGGMYLRAASGSSFLAFFQGYPVGGTGGTYNQFAVANAQVVENEIYTIDTDNNYHRQGCSHIGTVAGSAYSKEECAVKGAFACPYCFPNTGAHKTW